MTVGISTDDLWPRIPSYRYRIYGRREQLNCVAAAPSMTAVGLAILTLHEDCKRVGGTFADYGVLGILDTLGHGAHAERPGPTGEWIVLPWEARR